MFTLITSTIKSATKIITYHTYSFFIFIIVEVFYIDSADFVFILLPYIAPAHHYNDTGKNLSLICMNHMEEKYCVCSVISRNNLA